MPKKNLEKPSLKQVIRKYHHWQQASYSKLKTVDDHLQVIVYESKIHNQLTINNPILGRILKRQKFENICQTCDMCFFYLSCYLMHCCLTADLFHSISFHLMTHTAPQLPLASKEGQAFGDSSQCKQSISQIFSLVVQELTRYLDTLKDLVSIG